MLEGKPFFKQDLLVTFRQSFVAIEILFVQIPIRHNFSLEHVETWAIQNTRLNFKIIFNKFNLYIIFLNMMHEWKSQERLIEQWETQ